MYYKQLSRQLLLTGLVFFLLTSTSSAQLNRGNDTTYYQYFPGSITSRFYFSQKYTAFTILNKNATDLRYLPNTTLNMGVGATYHNFSLNLAYGFPFLNNDKDKGKTKYLDLQGHFYKPIWVTDVYGQFYKGYHLADGLVAKPGENYYYRPDAHITLLGVSMYRIFNSTRFSYRAALIQNEWQKKSAGTFLAGAEVYYGIINADSTLVPQQLSANYPQNGVNKINYISIGPGIGYAYTLVFFQHIFITGSLTGNINFNETTEHHSGYKNNRFTVQLLTRFRAAVGYNGRSWNISANWVADDLPFGGKSFSNDYALQTGNYRLIIARRLMPGPKLKKKLQILDAIFKE